MTHFSKDDLRAKLIDQHLAAAGHAKISPPDTTPDGFPTDVAPSNVTMPDTDASAGTVQTTPETTTLFFPPRNAVIHESCEKNEDASPLARYSVQGRVAELEKQAVEQAPILGHIALMGQATVIYAKPNTGKTLITLFLIIEAVKQGNLDPSKLFYINMDDNGSGLVEKARLAEEYGFQMVADGYQGFEAKVFRGVMKEMITSDTARGVIVVLDTLKKFVNIMDKGKSTDFAKVIRQFVIKGGTVIALSHTNKHAGLDGKPVFSGTSDIVDDFDCAYTIATVSEEADKNQKVVEFSNFKRRGDVAFSAAYGYALEKGISYNELLMSVQEVESDQLLSAKFESEARSDAEVIDAISTCVREGVNTKMKLATAVAERAKVSKKLAMKIIEKYTGNDLNKHFWTFAVRDRGAQVFELLERPVGQPPAPA